MTVAPPIGPQAGFGAAWALWKKFPSAEFKPVKHGYPPPPNLKGRHIVMVDFSYHRPALEAMAQEAASLQVLDHHITAQDALAGLPFAYFDLKKSGAVLAWEWAHQQPAPWLLQYVQDKDLWTWALPGRIGREDRRFGCDAAVSRGCRPRRPERHPHESNRRATIQRSFLLRHLARSRWPSILQSPFPQ